MKSVKAYRGVGAGHCGVVSVERTMFAPAGQQPHERVCLQTGGARCAPPSARPAALPLLQLCLLCAGAGFICPGHVSFDADFPVCSVGRVLTPPRNCRKTLVGRALPARAVCLARKPSRKMRCGGKRAGDQWSPYTRNKAGMQFFDGLRSGQDRSLQISRQRCGGYNKVGGNKKSHHGRWWEKILNVSSESQSQTCQP